MPLTNPLVQADSYPWIAALLRDEDIEAGYINSQCAAVLVDSLIIIIFQTSLKSPSPSPQIGNRFALTAAHCLYDDDNKEVLPASSFSIMLGLHDRRKAKEANRWLCPKRFKIFICPIFTRKQTRVSKILVHENFTDTANDIALLRLGRRGLYDF